MKNSGYRPEFLLKEKARIPQFVAGVFWLFPINEYNLNMERTVPQTASDEVELYLRTYYSLLRSTSDVQILTLEEAHSGTNSLLHPHAREETPDMSAFLYSLLRLPDCIHQVKTVILGQSTAVFARGGFPEVESWQMVSARARRRRCFFDGESTLACVISSQSDIDDVVPALTALQIEWEKLHRRIQSLPQSTDFDLYLTKEKTRNELAEALGISLGDLYRLQQVWQDDFASNLQLVRERLPRFRIRLLNGSLSEYRRATHAWWDHIEAACPLLRERPVYFVSSNTHSLVNLISGFALENRESLLHYLEKSDDIELQTEWRYIQSSQVPSSQENFLYYLLKKYMQTQEGYGFRGVRREHEKECGIIRVDSEHYFDVDVQIIDLAKVRPEWMDARLCQGDFDFLSQTDALILNIDYPLGMAAYNILSEVSEHVGDILGVYILGKAATLNGVIGDIMIPNVVHDEHSQNSYLVPNCFTAVNVAPYLVYGTVLDNQKAVTVLGTFLQNAQYMDVFYREGYTDIEMEAGPYLSAVYEMFRPKRHPYDEIINFYNLPFDLGIMHYASDTPLSKGKNLGASTLSYFGMDPTYATSITTLRRIILLESQRISRSR